MIHQLPLPLPTIEPTYNPTKIHSSLSFENPSIDSIDGISSTTTKYVRTDYLDSNKICYLVFPFSSIFRCEKLS